MILQHFLARPFTVYYKKNLPLEAIKQDLKADDYTIFTGTAGLNRKAVVAFSQGKRVGSFLKLPVGRHSAQLIRKEKEQLQIVASKGFTAFTYPQQQEVTMKEALLQSNIAGGENRSLNNFGSGHTAIISEMHQKTGRKVAPQDCAYLDKVRGYLQHLSTGQRIFLSDDLFLYLEQLLHETMGQKTLSVAMSHGDFVPWNMCGTEQQPGVFDWELADEAYPAMFDAFHFVIQSAILNGNKPFDEVLKALENLRKREDIQVFMKSMGLDFDQQLKQYLLLHVSHYLLLYSQQEKLHKQVYWLLNTWLHLIAYTMNNEVSKLSRRESFVPNLFQVLNEKGINYAVLKTAGKNVLKPDPFADIDILIEKKSLDELLSILTRVNGIQRYKLSRKSNLTTLAIFFQDQSFLSLDFVTAFKRRALVYMSASHALKRRIYDERGFYRLKSSDDLNYILSFYLLNNGEIPEHYKNYFLEMDEISKFEVLSSINKRLNLGAQNLEDLIEGKEELKKNMNMKVKKMKTNRGVHQLKNKLQYMVDTMRGLFTLRGFTITLSGVDGAGKSTLLELVKTYVEKDLRRQVVLLRHRPSVLPILSAYVYGKEEAEQRSAAKLPRTGNNTSVPKSVLRFMYYYLDYVLGQWMVYFKYTLRGKVVIYDRYYFDFINDPKRSNLQLPKGMARRGYALVFKPLLNIYLYAQPDVILARKKELDAETITELNEKYLSTFNRFGKRYKHSKYVAVENLDIDDTMNVIKQNINAVA